ncbi:MAG: hypothetical protein FDZ70_03060 [Actinobacteria bacterium]|nr:MAG: hypothetical protein FDZ70_03060 [Actinomycetota bacterium]
MRVAFIEFDDEIDGLLAALANDGIPVTECRVVALEPRARLALKWRGIDADSTVPYFSNAAHERVMRGSEALMQRLRAALSGFTDERGVSVAYATELCHNARMLYNHLAKTLEVIVAAAEVAPGAAIYAAVGAGCTSRLMIDDTERYAGRLARRWAQGAGRRFVDIGGVAADARPAADRVPRARPAQRVWASLVAGALRRREVVMLPRASGYLAPLVESLRDRLSDLEFLGMDFEGSLDKAVAGTFVGAMRRGLPPATVAVSWFGARASGPERAALSECVASAFAPCDETLYHGVELSDLLQAKAAAAYLPALLRMLDDSAGLAELYRRVPHALLVSAVALGRMSVAGELAAVLGRRSLFVSHGSHPVPVDDTHEIELLNLARGFMLSEYTHVALATPVQEAHLRYFRERYPWVRAEGVRTGPLVFARTDPKDRPAAKKALGLREDAFVITHAVTVKARSGERFHNVETIDEFIEGVSALVLAMDRLPGAHLLLRVHPGFVLTDHELRGLLPESDRYTIDSSGPFAGALAATDLLVSYSSTAIDEALLNRIPVLLWDKWARYDHFRTPAFDGTAEGCWPVCYVDDEERLAEALAWVRARVESGGPPTDAELSPYDYGEEYFDALVRFVRESFDRGRG